MAQERIEVHLHSPDGHGAPSTPNLQHVVALSDARCCNERVQLGDLRLLQGSPCQDMQVALLRRAALLHEGKMEPAALSKSDS